MPKVTEQRKTKLQYSKTAKQYTDIVYTPETIMATLH